MSVPHWNLRGVNHRKAQLDESKVAALRAEKDNEKLAKLAKEFGIALSTAKRYRQPSQQRWKKASEVLENGTE
jgi:hypothetical protein